MTCVQYVRHDVAVISHKVTYLPVGEPPVGEAPGPSVPSGPSDTTPCGSDAAPWGFTLAVHSRHGVECAMPMVESVRLWLPLAGLPPQLIASLEASSSSAAGVPGGALRGEMPGLTPAYSPVAPYDTAGASGETKEEAEDGACQRGNGGVGGGRDAPEAGGSGGEFGPALSSGRSEPALCIQLAGPAPFRFSFDAAANSADAVAAVTSPLCGATPAAAAAATLCPIPGGLPALRVRVELILREPWADADRRSVVLEHMVLRYVSTPAMDSANNQETPGPPVKEEERLSLAAAAASSSSGVPNPPPVAMPRPWAQAVTLPDFGPTSSTHRFVTQVRAL